MKIAKKIQYIINQKQSNALDSFQESSEIFELLSMYCKYEEANQLVINNLSLASFKSISFETLSVLEKKKMIKKYTFFSLFQHTVTKCLDFFVSMW